MTFGKVMGGGFPAAAFGGRADVMDLLAPVGPVYQAGTLSGNPIATTAGLTTLQLATDEAYGRLDATSAELQRLVGEALAAEGVDHVVQNVGNMFSVFWGVDTPVANFAERAGAGGVALQGVLPRHARRRRLPPAERIRVLVRLGRTRCRGTL